MKERRIVAEIRNPKNDKNSVKPFRRSDTRILYIRDRRDIERGGRNLPSLGTSFSKSVEKVLDLHISAVGRLHDRVSHKLC